MKQKKNQYIHVKKNRYYEEVTCLSCLQGTKFNSEHVLDNRQSVNTFIGTVGVKLMVHSNTRHNTININNKKN